MGRKNLLSGLLGDPGAPVSPGPPAPSASHPSTPRPRGAIGAFSQGIADLKARSVVEIDPALIDAGGLTDRLESDAAEDGALARSIGEYGQQVPVLVRPHPGAPGRYQIVYGRRRVRALRDLGQPVRALVRDLDDRALVMAQGQENTARRDLSFIEKANFARQMTAAGYDRRAICDALTVDKTVISRMLSVAERVPVEVIEYVGSAPGVGRERWLALADRLAARGSDPPAGRDEEPLHLIRMIAVTVQGDDPDARFDALQAYLDRPAPPAPGPAADATADPAPLPRRQATASAVTGARGERLGSARRTESALILRLDRAGGLGFEDWLLDHLPEIHRDWSARRGG